MSSLKINMAKGVMWTAVGKYAGVVVSIIVSMILARLISPEDFGVVAIAQVVITFVGVLSDLGIGTAVIQNKTLSESDLDSIFTFTILFAFLCSGVVTAASPFVADYYGNAKLIPVCAMIALAMLFNIVNTVPQSLFMKNKRFAFTAKRDLLFNCGGCIISIVYALMGGGCYALVLTPIITAAGLLTVNLRQYPRHIDWHMHMAPIRKIFSFSVFQLLFCVENYFSRNLDKLIIGKSLSLTDLGYYQKSYNLMMMPMQNITFVITPVLQPFLSDFQNDLKFIAEKYLQIIKLVATISVPLGIMLYFTAYELVTILYGVKWEPAVPAFRILALSVPLQMVLSTSGSIFQATNRTKALFITGVITTCETVLGFLVCAFIHGGMVAFATAWTVTNAVCFITTYIIMYRFEFGISSWPVYKQFAHPMVNGIIIFASCYGIQTVLGGSSPFLSLILKIAASGVSTVLVVLFYKDYNLKYYFKAGMSRMLGFFRRFRQ